MKSLTVKDFVKDAVGYLPSQVVPAIVGFVSISIITRLFLPAEYGNYSLVMSTVAVLLTVTNWLPLSVNRFYSAFQRDGKLTLFYGNVLQLSLISVVALALGFYLILLAARSCMAETLYRLMVVGIGCFALTSVFAVLNFFLRMQRKAGWYSGFVVWRSITAFLFGLSLVYLLKMNVEGLLYGGMLSSALALPILWYKAMHGTAVRPQRVSLPIVRDFAHYSVPLVLGNLANWVLSLSDRYVIEFISGSQAVGVYSASYAVSERIMMLFLSLFTLASGPISYHIWEHEGEEKSKEFRTALTRHYVLGAVPLAVGLSVLAKPLIACLTGEQYSGGHIIIPFVVTGLFLLGLQQRYIVGLTYHRKTGMVPVIVVVCGLLNLGLNILFIPEFGYIAAAVSTLASYALLLLLMILVSRRLFTWKFPLKSLLNAALASVAMGATAFYVGRHLTSHAWLNLGVAAFLGATVYGILLLLLKELRPQEEAILKNIVSAWRR